MKKIVFLFILFPWIMVYGQEKYTISGYISDAGSGEKLIGANVVNLKNSAGMASNVYGFYSITLPVGEVKLMFSYVGYGKQVHTFVLNRDTILNIGLKQSLEIGEVMVTASESRRIEHETQMSITDIPLKQIQTLPSLLGETDLLKTVQLLPGVQSGNEGQSGFYVRGGSPDQNLILLDGVPVYNASHLFGFFSVFNTDAISDVKLIKGGFPARYGGRLSSVLDIRIKDGHQSEYHGNLSVGLISAKGTIEGPIIKNKTSFIVSGRRTYADFIARPFLKKGFKEEVIGGVKTMVPVLETIKGTPERKTEIISHILCEEVINHLDISEIRIFLQLAHKYLIPGGRIRISVPDANHPNQEYINKTIGKNDQSFNYKNIINFLREAGFKKPIVREGYIEGNMFNISTWYMSDGLVKRSFWYDPKNIEILDNFLWTSLIVDGIK